MGRRQHLTAKIWKYSNNFEFPEAQYLETKENVGLAFSGGGNRSAGLTIGFLRGLKKLGLLDNIKYISGVSGGAWAALPYTYLDSSIDDDDFLGQVTDPADLKLEDVEKSQKRSFVNAISNTVLFDDFLGSLLKNLGDEIFAKIMSNLYLKGFLIGDTKKFFTWNDESLAEILSRGDNVSELGYEDFYMAKTGRPYLICSGVLSRPKLLEINRYPFEMTPLYCGIPSFHEKAGSWSKFDIGGGYTDPYGIDSDSPDEQPSDDLVSVRVKNMRNRFSLADVMAITGSAPAEYTDRFGLEIGFPELKYWSPVNPDKAKEYDFVDGGYLDNTGIIPLLRRKAKKIVVFMNTSSSVKDGKFSTAIKSLFNETKIYSPNNLNLNIVLEKKRGQRDLYEELESHFLNLAVSEIPVYREVYQTVDNSHYNIVGGEEVEILWVYNSYYIKWTESLKDPSLKDYVQNQRTKKNFPNYATFLLNSPKIIDMSPEQANILAHHAAYIVGEAEHTFKDFISGAGSV